MKWASEIKLSDRFKSFETNFRMSDSIINNLTFAYQTKRILILNACQDFGFKSYILGPQNQIIFLTAE